MAPRAAESDGPDAVRFAAAYGLTPFEWQEDVLDDWLGRRPDGRWAATTCGLDVSRQNGKNAVIEVREFYGAALLGEKIIHTAHQVKTAREAFLRVAQFFEDERHPEIASLVKEVRRANGQEAVTLNNGGQIRFIARSGPSGRGMTADVLILDEAQDLSNEELAALLPMVSASPLGNPQVILTGTPPDPERPGHGEVFRRIRAEGESKRDARMSWTDYGIPDGPLPDLANVTVRHELVLNANPSLVEGLFDLEVAEREFSIMPPEVFARERLSWWGDPMAETTSAFPNGLWAAAFRDEVPPTPNAIGLAVSLDQAWGSIAAAGRLQNPEGPACQSCAHASCAEVAARIRIDAVDRRPGTAWLVAEAARIQTERECAVVIDEKGPAADLIPTLEAAGVRLTKARMTDYLDACSSLHRGVCDRAVTHGGTDELEAAVTGAAKRDVGDRWAWGRRKSTTDVSMLEAATLAAWGVDHAAKFAAALNVW